MFSLFIASALLVAFLFGRFAPSTPSYVVEMAQNLCEIGAVVFSVRVVERDSLRHFGFPQRADALRSIIWGAVFGVGSVAAYTLVFVASGWARFTQPLAHPLWSPALLWLLVLMILVGFGEEMMTRGYTLTLIRRQTGKVWLAVAVSAAAFALLHSLNTGYSTLAVVNLLLFATVAARMYLKSGSLWMPIAYHVSWDYFEGNVFGYPNSGHNLQSLYAIRQTTLNLITGGRFGPESGILVTLLLLLALAWTQFLYRPRTAAVTTVDAQEPSVSRDLAPAADRVSR